MVEGVTKALETDRTFDIVEDLLKDNVTDPRTGRATSAFIHDGFPNINRLRNCKDDSFTWPILVIEDPNTTREALSVDKAQTLSIGNVTCEVVIYAESHQQKRTLVDGVVDALYTNASNLSKGALQNLAMPVMSDDVDFFGQDKIRIKRITFSWRRVD